jgi:hypothetical protein
LNAFEITFDGRLSAARKTQDDQLHQDLDSPKLVECLAPVLA